MKEVLNVYLEDGNLKIVTDDEYYYIDDGYTLTRYPNLESAIMSVIK